MDLLGKSVVAPAVDAAAIGSRILVLYFLNWAFFLGPGLNFALDNLSDMGEVGEDDAAGVVLLGRLNDGLGEEGVDVVS